MRLDNIRWTTMPNGIKVGEYPRHSCRDEAREAGASGRVLICNVCAITWMKPGTPVGS